MKNKKILIFANFRYPGGDPLVISKLTQKLSKRGYDFVIMAPIENDCRSLIKECRWIKEFIPYKYSSNAQKKISNYLRKNCPDLFLISGSAPFALEAACTFKRPAISRIIGHPKWWINPMGGEQIKAHDLIRLIGAFSDRIISVSGFINRVFKQAGVKHIQTIHEGCDTSLFYPSQSEKIEFRKEFKLSKDTIVFGVFANFTWQKQHHHVLEALLRYQKINLNFKCFFFGGSTNRDMFYRKNELINMAQKMGLANHLICAGFRKDIRTAMNGTDIALFPFLEEAFGMALVESMACEIPVIVNDSGSFPEIVTSGKEGLVVKTHLPALFSKAIHALTSNRQKMLRMGKNGRKKVMSHFSFEQHVDAYDKLFRELI